MKTIIIAAATLMAGASVYGVIDYNKKSGIKEFKNLYNEEKPVVEAPSSTGNKGVEIHPVAEKTTEQKVTESKKEAKPAVKKNPRKKKISYKSFSRAEPKDVVLEEKTSN